MPEFTTHTEGGGWLGGGQEVPDCDERKQQMILDAFDRFIDDPCLDCFPGLRASLDQIFKTVKIKCEGCDDLHGSWNGQRILLCADIFDPLEPGLPFTTEDRVASTLLHELIHACGAQSELDPRAAEQHCFGFGPTVGELEAAKGMLPQLNGNENEHVGQFVIWNSATGEVFGKQTEGGGWLGGGEIVKGDLCFQSDGWIITESEDGGAWL